LRLLLLRIVLINSSLIKSGWELNIECLRVQLAPLHARVLDVLNILEIAVLAEGEARFGFMIRAEDTRILDGMDERVLLNEEIEVIILKPPKEVLAKVSA
jgi:hypothetical protein